jgi:integrase
MGTKLIKFITIEDFQKIYKAEKKKEYKLAFALAFGSGLRISEIVGLKNKTGTFKINPLTAEQIDLKAHTIRVIGGKGLKDRVTVTSPLINETNIKLLPLKVSRRTLENRIKVLGKRELNKDICFHTLRHGFANFQANEKGLALSLLQQLLGHSRLDTTGIYTKANPIQAINKAWENF